MSILGLSGLPFSVSETVVLAGAIATALAAAAAAWQAREVRRTIGEQREDRRLLYQPYVDVYATSESPTGWMVENVGRGIALKCAAFTWLPPPIDLQASSPLMALGAGNTKPLDGWILAEPADHVFAPFDHAARLDVAICEDELGNLHRFGPNAEHDVWQRGRANAPGWTHYRRSGPSA